MMEVVGKFQFNRSDIIGQGASGIVFKGCSTLNSNQAVAVKAVKKKLGKHAELLSKEIQILKGLTEVKHENIVALLECKVSPQHVFLIMEFCNGGNLEEYLQAHRMVAESTIAHFLRQIASAMKLFTTMGIVHRDMKPQNILLCYAESSCSNPLEITLKIADFGFARFLEDGIMAATLCGSPLYMAPEVFMCQPYDAKADLWSVATIVYQCLTGAAPFLAQTPQMLRNFYEHTPVLNPSFPRSTSDSLKSLLLGILKRNPKDRMDFRVRSTPCINAGKAANDAEETFLPASYKVQLRNTDKTSFPVPRRRRVVSYPGLSSRPLSPCLDDYVIIPDIVDDIADDDDRSSETATPTNSISLTSPQSVSNMPSDVFNTMAPYSSSQPMTVPPRRGSLPSQPSDKFGHSTTPTTPDLMPSFERHVSQPALTSYGSPRTRSFVPRSSFPTLPALDEIRPHFDFPESPPQSWSAQQIHGSARPCLPTLMRRNVGLAKNLTPNSRRTASPTSPLFKEPVQRSPSYSNILAIESMSPPPVQFVVGSSSPPTSIDIGQTLNRRNSANSPTPYHFISQGVVQPMHHCQTDPIFDDGSILQLTQVSASCGRSAVSLSSSPLTRYFSRESLHDVVRFKPVGMEGPISFVVPELSSKTLLNEEHNAILEKVEFIAQLARVIADVARERSSPLAGSLVMGNHSLGGAPLTPTRRQMLQFEYESQRWTEQMVLYVRALQLLSSALHLCRGALKDGRLERVSSIKNAVLELNTCYQECLVQLQRLKVHANRYRGSELSIRMVTADELMYSSALEMCKLGVMDEHLGNIDQCAQHYRNAYILLHGLARYAYVSRDRSELDRYKTNVERRLRLLHDLGFVQISR